MNEELNTSGKNPVEDSKAKMLAAIAKKRNGNLTAKNSGPTTGSKIGAGQAGGTAPKMHRRKAGSA
jgi:hypothetical protein